MRVYHFARIENGVPVMRDGTPIEIGKKYSVNKHKVAMCECGFHGSINPLDALKYAPGNYISIRKLSGKIVKGDDKVVASECVHVAGFDGEGMLRKFARLCALDVIYLWYAPDVVVRYLKTGDESLRDAAWDAARNAVIDATNDDAWYAARNAAWYAASNAAWDAARNAVIDATWATWYAARNAAWNARKAASNAVIDATWAAWDAARNAAWNAAGAKQSKRLKRMINYRIKQMEENV